MSDNALRVVRPFHSRTGSISLAFLLLASLSLIGMPFVMTGMSSGRLQTRSTGSVIAFAAAEAGLQQVLWMYNHAFQDFTGQGWCVSNQACAANATPQCPQGAVCAWKTFTWTDGSGADISNASVTIQNYFTGNCTPCTPRVLSTGSALASGVQAGVDATLTTSGFPGFQEPVRAAGRIVFASGALVDNYDRSLGEYGALLAGGALNQSHPSDPALWQKWQAYLRTQSEQADDPGTPATEEHAIVVHANGQVRGGVSVGAGATGPLTQYIFQGVGANVGTQGKLAFVIDPVDAQSVSPGSNVITTCPGNQLIIDVSVPNHINDRIEMPDTVDNCTVIITGSGENQELHMNRLQMDGDNNRVVFQGSGQTQVMLTTAFQLGDYGKVQLDAGKSADIIIDGTTGWFKIGNNAQVNYVNAAGNAERTPANFDVTIRGSTLSIADDFELGMGSQFYGVLDAPNSDVHLSGGGVLNTEFYGAIIAGSFSADPQVQVHWDTSLRSHDEVGDDPPFTATVTSWKRTQ